MKLSTVHEAPRVLFLPIRIVGKNGTDLDCSKCVHSATPQLPVHVGVDVCKDLVANPGSPVTSSPCQVLRGCSSSADESHI